MNDLEILNLMADIESRRAEVRKELRRLERWQNLATGIMLMGIGIALLAGLWR